MERTPVAHQAGQRGILPGDIRAPRSGCAPTQEIVDVRSIWAMTTKPVVEDFPRIYANELVRRARFDSTVTVRHHGLLLSVTLSRAGSYLQVRSARWELVPAVIT